MGIEQANYPALWRMTDIRFLDGIALFGLLSSDPAAHLLPESNSIYFGDGEEHFGDAH